METPRKNRQIALLRKAVRLHKELRGSKQELFRDKGATAPALRRVGWSPEGFGVPASN